MIYVTCENIRKGTQISEFIRKGKNSIVFLQLIYKYGILYRIQIILHIPMPHEHRFLHIYSDYKFIYILHINEGIRIWSSVYSIFLCVIEMVERNLAFLQVQE